jgi:excisionase family DNA binding protein
MTPRQVAAYLRVGRDRVLNWLRKGELGAVNLAAPGDRPRFVVLPHHLAEFERWHAAAAPPKPARRRRRPAGYVDFFPD